MIQESELQTIRKSEGGSFEPLESDVYQVQIVDIQLKENEYMGKKSKQLEFTSQVATPLSDKDHGRQLKFWTSTTWNMGGGKYSPSKLFTLVTSVYKHYKPDVSVKDMEEIQVSQINDLIGKQVRVNVVAKEREDGKTVNKVESFLPIKAPVEFEPVEWKKNTAETDEDFERDMGFK